MDGYRKISERLAIAGQPSQKELAELKQQGYAAVVNLRRDGEPHQELSPEVEGEVVRELGLEYHHYAIGGQPLDREEVEDVLAFLDRHQNDRVFLHCLKGARAAAILVLAEAQRQGWNDEQALDYADRTEGLKLEGPVRSLVENYLKPSS